MSSSLIFYGARALLRGRERGGGEGGMRNIGGDVHVAWYGGDVVSGGGGGWLAGSLGRYMTLEERARMYIRHCM